MIKQFYFYNDYDEECYTKERIIEMMREDGVIGKKVFKAVKEDIKDVFYCREYTSLVDKGECGKQCESYDPRNGKSGICKHHGNLYAQGEKVTIKIKEDKP